MSDRDKRDARLVQQRTGISYAAALDAVRAFHAVPKEQRMPWLLNPLDASGCVTIDGAQRLAWACGRQPGPRNRYQGWSDEVVEIVPPTSGRGHTMAYHQFPLHAALFGQPWTGADFLREAVRLIADAPHAEEFIDDLASCRAVLAPGRLVLRGDVVPVTAEEFRAVNRVAEEAAAYWILNDYASLGGAGSLDQWLGQWALETGGSFSCKPDDSVQFTLPAASGQAVLNNR